LSVKWQLSLAVDKCGWMLLSRRANIRNFDFKMTEIDLATFNEVRDLGILFKSNLCFETHIDSIIAKSKQRLYLIKKSFTSSDCYALVLAFKSYVIPLLEYCSPVWSPSQIGSILRIESVQRLFTK